MAKIKSAQVKKKAGNLDEAVREIRARFGEESIMMLGSKPRVDVDAISTQSMGLDWALGIGGLPRGRIVEISGPEASGKTTLALHVIAEAQKHDGTAAFIDAEHAMDPEYAKRLGVKTNELLISQPFGGEEALNIAHVLVEGGMVDVIVVDSVAMLVPKAELEGDIGQQHMAGQARLMAQALRKLTSLVAKSKCLLIFINQLRSNPGGFNPGGGPPPDITAGGKALKYACSVRVEVRRIATIKKGEEVMGSRIRAKVVKNKVAPPFKQTEFDLMFGEGISIEGELLALGEKYDVTVRSGAMYRFGDATIGRGYDAAKSFLKENPKVADEIRKEIKKGMES